jgi:hypothetical protein
VNTILTKGELRALEQRVEEIMALEAATPDATDYELDLWLAELDSIQARIEASLKALNRSHLKLIVNNSEVA